MENKKSHIRVLVTTTCVIIFLITLIILGYLAKKDELSSRSIMWNVVIVLWFGTYPISFYTCWRIAFFEEKEHNGFVSHLIYSIRGNAISLIFAIPLLLSPFFIMQYIKLFKMDNESKYL